MQDNMKSIDLENQSALLDFVDWHRNTINDRSLDYNDAIMNAKFAKTPEQLQEVWRRVDRWIDWY